MNQSLTFPAVSIFLCYVKSESILVLIQMTPSRLRLHFNKLSISDIIMVGFQDYLNKSALFFLKAK